MKKRGRKPTTDWEAVDWSLPNKAIADRFGVNTSSVSYHRKRLGKPKLPRYVSTKTKAKRAAKRAKWDAVDWTKQDCEIAEELGVSRERSRQIRMSRGEPSPPQKWRKQKSIIKSIAALPKDELAESTAAEIAEQFGVIRNTVYAAVRIYDLKLKNGRLHGGRTPSADLLNWELSNTDLARIWGFAASWKVAQHRHKLGKPTARWDGRYKTNPVDPTYKKAVALEELRAEEWFNAAPKRSTETKDN